MEIPSWPQAGERERDLLRLVLESSQWGGFHPFVQEFERSFAEFQHAKEGISAFNGTVTIELALSILGIGPGDEVIVPAISFISTATAVSRVGATPVFLDIEPWSFNIDPTRVREAITKRTKAIVPVHFGGTMCRIADLVEICSEYRLALIEDAAHAHGSEWAGRRAGSFGIAGSFSFQNGKAMCAGEGGILVTSDPEFAENARSVANQGRVVGRSFYEHHRLGTNLRMTAFQAAVLLAQFERLPVQIERRRSSAALLKSLLPAEKIVWQEQPFESTANSWYLLCARLAKGVCRDAFCHELNAAGVPCTPFYPHTLYQNPVYQQPGSCRVTPCPNSEAYLADAFWLPHRVLLSQEETIREIAEIMARLLGG